MSQPSDSDCVKNTLAGSREAFRPLIDRYLPRVSAFLRPLVRDEFAREDVCQETFLRAFEKLATYDPARPFGPWLLRIAYHLAVRNHRQKGEQDMPLWEEADNWHPKLTYEPDPDARLWVDSLVAQLPTGIRLLFLLKYSLELTYEEMGEIFEEAPAAIKTRIHRACLQLRTTLKESQTAADKALSDGDS